MLRHERTGNPSPIEVQPSRAGNIDVDLEAGTWRHHPGLKPLGELYHLNHFASCPAASQWRRARTPLIAESRASAGCG